MSNWNVHLILPNKKVDITSQFSEEFLGSAPRSRPRPRVYFGACRLVEVDGHKSGVDVSSYCSPSFSLLVALSLSLFG